MKRNRSIGWLLLMAVMLGIAGGCSTPDTENMAERPWNAPKSWEHGLPPSIMEGR